ncbi:MAG: hypothetical protein ACI9SP_002023 [Arenicella sp.]|jgi:hypothetical protein
MKFSIFLISTVWIATSLSSEVAIASDETCIDTLVSTEKSKRTPDKLLACLQKIQAKINSLESNETEIHSIPKGAVVAFDRTPSKPCPEGWTVWREAMSRVIIGAGNPESAIEQKFNRDKNGIPLSARAYREHGGEELVTLKISEMPSHKHDALRVPWGSLNWEGGKPAKFWDRNGGKYQNYKTGAAGENEPHNNMPPYVALYYCKKQ